MRIGLPVALLVSAVVGCGPAGGGDYGYYPIGGGPNGGCHLDSDCGSDPSIVCARTGECLAATDVRHVQTSWTVQGSAASDASCAAHPSLEIDFQSDYQGDDIGFLPVPCNEGRFTIDKMPTRYISVTLGSDNGTGQVGANFDGSGDATLDLP